MKQKYKRQVPKNKKSDKSAGQKAIKKLNIHINESVKDTLQTIAAASILGLCFFKIIKDSTIKKQPDKPVIIDLKPEDYQEIKTEKS